ncbi:MAG: hypothetical protein M1840_007915 [Geoglossum simile]|nr:MAG: hypothetical protein M1840_007915 [Geoglossum simile]
MSLAHDKQWAAKYILGPLTALEPSDETGPGTHFVSSVTRVDTLPGAAPLGRRGSLMGPRHPVSPERQNDCPAFLTPANSRRHEGHQMSLNGTRQGLTPAFHPHHPGHRQTYSMDGKPLGSCVRSETPELQRSHSVQARYRGDQGARPLEILRREAKRAYRSPHLQRTQLPGPDMVDWLDGTGMLYHHEGPYDATLLARNTSPANSPVAAVRRSNEEALKATPREKIKDALERHRPLDGVADVRSGASDFLGRRLEYEEGPDLMVEEGKYKRWPGVEYLPEDLKGKGEPSFTAEKSRKELKSNRHRRGQSELTDLSSTPKPAVWSLKKPQRSNSTGGRLSEGLRRRFGGLLEKRRI